jgi:hypothetical protein
MDEKIAQEILDELFPALEALETQSAAILQFLKERKIATDKDLAPFLEQAANASNVRWRAARLRMERLFAGAIKSAEESEKKTREAADEKAKTPPPEPAAHDTPRPEAKPEAKEDAQAERARMNSTPQASAGDGNAASEDKPGPQEKKDIEPKKSPKEQEAA